MKHRRILAFLTFLLVAGTASAQEYQMQWSAASGIDYVMTNYGVFGHDVSRNDPGLTDDGLRYLYGSGLYFGTRKIVRDTLRPLVVLGYNPNSGGSWFTPGEYPGTDTNAGAPILYYSSHYDRTTGADTRTGSYPHWPLWLPGGQLVPTTTAPGHYVVAPVARTSASGPFARPAFMPFVSEQWATRYHDGNLDRYEGQDEEGAYPIGLQIQQVVYSWRLDDVYHNVVVLQYEVINRSSDTLRDCVLGQASDPDLGRAANDHVAFYRGGDGKVRAGIAYTERTIGDTNGYGALVQVLLESPSVGGDGFIDNSLRAELGSLHEITTFRDWSIESDPKTGAERYAFMATPRLDADTVAGDKRTMLAVGPFSMLPGDTAHFALAFVVYDTLIAGAIGVPDPATLAQSGGLDLLIGNLIEDYAVVGRFRSVQVSSAPGESRPAERGLTLSPNPAAATTLVSFNARGGEVDALVYDALGNVVLRQGLGTFAAGPRQSVLDCAGLPAGAYLVRMIGADGSAAPLMITR